MRSPADEIYYEPPKLFTREGFGEAIGMVRRRIASGFAPTFLDAGFIAILWILVTYALSWLMWREIRYLLVPGWVFALGVIEATALWQSFGRSLGQKICGKQLLGEGRTTPGVSQRVKYYLLWHFTVLPIIGLAWRNPLHERVSGLTAALMVRGGEKPAPWYRTTSGLFVATIVVAMLVTTFAITIEEGTWARFLQNPSKAGRIFSALTNPNFQFWKDAVYKLIVTVYMAIMATLVGVIVAAPLSFFAARNLTKTPVARLFYTLIRGILSIFRSIEPIVWAIVFLVWVGAGKNAFAGFLALLVHTVADLTKLYAERLESIDNGPLEAITATGGSWLSVLRYAVVPQIVNPYISFTLYRWDINIRMSAIVGLVGGGGIGQLLLMLLRAQRFRDAAVCVYLIAVLVLGIDILSSVLRRYFEKGRPIEAAEENALKDVTGDPRVKTQPEPGEA